MAQHKYQVVGKAASLDMEDDDDDGDDDDESVPKMTRKKAPSRNSGIGWKCPVLSMVLLGAFVMFVARQTILPAVVPVVPEVFEGPDGCELPARARWCTVRSNGFTFLMAVHAQGDVVSGRICADGFWEESPLDLVAYVGKVGTALDIGGNLGYYTTMLAKAGWRVHTFEPIPLNLAMINATLCANTDIQPLISVHPVGLGEAAVRCAILSTDDNIGDGVASCGGAWQSEQRFDGYKVRHEFDTVRLDDVLESSNVTEIDYVKLDVEGFECHVLAGGQSLITKYRPKLITSEVWSKMDGCNASDYIRQFNDANYVVSSGGDWSCGKDACCSVPEAGIHEFRFCRKQ